MLPEFREGGEKKRIDNPRISAVLEGENSRER